MNKQIKLKPCPFCDSTEIKLTLCEQTNIKYEFEAAMCYVCCNCGATGGAYRTKENATNAWNTRKGEKK